MLIDGADIPFQHLILGCEPSEVRMGMRVAAVWKPRDQWGTTAENIDHFEPTGGKLPVNPSGGVLSSNPIGASGLLRFAESALQVTGKAGEHQVAGARTALGHAYGGGSQYFSMWVVATTPQD